VKATAILMAVALVATPTWAAGATIHTVEAQRLEGELSAITADGHLAIVRGGKTTLVPLAKVYRIDLLEKPPLRPDNATVEVRTVNGSRAYGSLARPRDALALRCAGGRLTLALPVGRLLAVRFDHGDDVLLPDERFDEALAEENRAADVLFVAGPRGTVGFRVAVTKVGPKKVGFSWKGQKRAVDTNRVAAIIFANDAVEDEPAAIVQLTDTSVLRGEISSITRGRLSLDLDGTRLAIPLAAVHAIDIANPNIVFLSDLEPVAVQEIPFFNHIWKHRNDLSVSGSTLSLDGRKYERGIGCHTKTALTYDIGGKYRKFSAVIGIDDGARPRGSVTFIVRGDGKTLHQSTLTGRDKATHLALDIAGVRKLTLITNFADDAHVGDHANWADARVMK
jgi:hypothetical protein